METILVLSGVTRRQDVARFSYQPMHIVESVADLKLTSRKIVTPTPTPFASASASRGDAVGALA